jgi:alpha-1,2-mannosyltransferase
MRWVLVTLIVVVGVVFVRNAMNDDNDFDGFWRAGRHVLDAGSLSDARDMSRYPPTFHLFMVPFSLLPLGLAAAAWYVLSVLALLALPPALERLSGVVPREQLPVWLILSPLVVDNLILGQSGLLLLWICTWAVASIRDGRAVRGGAAIAAATLVKVLPVAVLVVPFVLGRSRAALLGVACAVVLGASVMVAAVGVDQSRSSSIDWAERNSAEQSPWALVEAGRSLRYNNQGLGVVLARTWGELGASEERARGAVRFAVLPLGIVWTAYGLILAMVAVVGAGAFRAACKLNDDRSLMSFFALTYLFMLFVSPVVWTHYFVQTIPAWIAISHRKELVRWGCALFVLGLLVTPLRALGLQEFMSLGLFLVVASDLVRRASERPLLAGAATGQVSSFPSQQLS